MSTSNNNTIIDDSGLYASSPESTSSGASSGIFDDANLASSSTLEQSQSESYTDWTRIVFMVLWLIALMLITFIIVSYIRGSRQPNKGGVASAPATSRTQHAQTHGNDIDEENNNVPVEIKPENIAEETREMATEVQELSQPVRNEKKLPGIVPIVTILIALSLSVTAQTSCDYVSTSNGISVIDHYAFQDVKISSFGLWSAAIYNGSYGSDDQCQSIFRHHGFTTDGKFIFARSVAILASTLGCIALLTAVYYAIVGKMASPRFRTVSLWLLGSATLTQGLVLVLFSADICSSTEKAYCEVGIGAISSITATIYWSIAALSVWCLRTIE